MSLRTISLRELLGDAELFTDGDWVESKDQDSEGNCRLIQLADVGDGYFVDKSSRFMNGEAFKRLKCTLLKKGDILIARMPDPLGRCCIFPGDEKNCATVVDVCIVRPNTKKNDASWLMHAINSENVRSQIKNYSRGAPRVRISRKDLGNILVPDIPLAEQKRIAAILDKAAAIKAKREKAIAKLQGLAQSTFVEMFGDPIFNSKNLQTVSVKSICKLINGRPFKPSEWEEVGLPIIRIQNLNNETKPFNYTTQKFDEKYLVKSGDVLFAWSGTPGTSFGCFKWTRQDGWLNQHIFKVILNTNLVNPDFFIQQLNLKLNELISQAHGGVGLQHVTKSMVDDLKLLIPKLDYQNEYASKLKKIDEIAIKFRAYQVESIKLNNSLEQQAFTTGFPA
jgi:type I restriction enzyme S subunit